MKKNNLGIQWFNENIKPLLKKDFKIKYVLEQNGDLGDLSGVQFDSPHKGGYIYFWDSGYVGFQLVDYDKGIELIEDSIEETTLRTYKEILNDLLLCLP